MRSLINLRSDVEFGGMAKQDVDDTGVLMFDSDVQRCVMVTHQCVNVSVVL